MAAAVLNPYLTFQNNAKEAMEFYHSVLGGELKITTFGEGMPPGHEDEGDASLIMHAVIENGPLTFMASDGGAKHPVHPGDNISMSLSGDDEAALTKYFNELSAGGKVTMPLEKAPWEINLACLLINLALTGWSISPVVKLLLLNRSFSVILND